MSVYPDCGTRAAAQRHRKYGDLPVCEDCLHASREYMRKHRHRTGQSQGTWVYVPDGDAGLLGQVIGTIKTSMPDANPLRLRKDTPKVNDTCGSTIV